MYKKLLLTLFCFLFAQGVLAETDELITSEQALAYGHRIMMDVTKGKLGQAWRKVKSQSTIPPERVDAFAADYNKRLVSTIQHFGPAVGVELVNQEAFGRSMMRVTYLVKYNVTGVAWFMYFYRMNNQWMLSEINYDLNSNTLFQMASATKSSGDQQFVMQGWQEQIESRLAKIEEGGVGGGGLTIDASKVNLDNSGAMLLLEMESRLRRIEEKLVALPDSEARLADIEQKYAAIRDQYDAITYQLDLKEIALLRRTIHVLKEQHPFADFPR